MSFYDVSDALWDLTEPTQLRVVTTQVVDFEAVAVAAAAVVFDASLQPLKSQALLVKPEGMRRWRWLTMLTTQKLEVNDVIEDGDQVQYRVMERQNWSQAGFYRYELAEGPPPAQTNPKGF